MPWGRWFLWEAEACYTWDYYWMNLSAPTPDWTDIRPDDTVCSWLNRTDHHPPGTWHYDDSSNTCWMTHHISGESDYVIRCLLTDGQLQEIAGRGAAAALVPPVWPGLDKVTLGTPVALSDDVTIPGPLDGVLVTITTPPGGLGKFEMGGRTAWYRAGQIAFVSDNGQVEGWQYLTWDQALYTPRAMSRAGAAILRALAGAQGIATPWLVT
jgi:hypothetical protein